MLPNISVSSLAEINYTDEIPETGQNLRENALIKAETIYSKFGAAVFADDTGLMVNALGGEPGVYSARYAGEKADAEKNMAKLLKALGAETNRKASFVTVIAFIDKQGVKHFFEGSVEGEILLKKQGNTGFGYDPIFQPKGYERSFAQMSLEEKNKISHRGRALQKFVQFIQQEYKKS